MLEVLDQLIPIILSIMAISIIAYVIIDGELWFIKIRKILEKLHEELNEDLMELRKDNGYTN